MTIDEKIRLGMLALSTAAAKIVAASVGIAEVKPPFMDELGGPASG